MPAAINWTPELTESVLEAIAEGSTLRKAAENNSISASAIIRHVTSNEEFAKQYARVLDIRGELDFEQLCDVTFEKPEYGDKGVDSGWVNWRRVQIDTVKWALSKRNPKKYGEKIQQEHTGEINLGLAEVIAEARKRAGKPE